MREFFEENATINGKVRLKGTASIPKGKGPWPAVLFIHGSGPTDRDENVKGIKINAFKELANAITPLGFVTLRYDKRGVGESEGNFLEAGLWDLVDDAGTAVEFLKQHPAVDPDKIILLGHSEGCAIAPAVNKRQPVQGLILLAGVAESVKDSIIRQAELAAKEIENLKGVNGFLLRLLGIPKKIAKSQKKSFGKIINSKEDVIKMQFQKINAKWMREHFAYNVVNDLRDVSCLTLAITGSKDVQVLPEHAKRLAETVKGKSEYYIIEGMNHLLRKQSSPTSILNIKKDYKKLANKPIDRELIEKILTWLKNNYCD